MKIGDKYQIHCYKHNGKAYQASDETIIIDIKKDYIVCGNYMVDVFEPEGHSYKTKELAIIFFYKKHWFNCIAQLKNFGLYYYCNMATPYIEDENVIKYGQIAMKYFCPFYFILGILNILAGTVRGAGKGVPPMLILLFSMCVFRILWIKIALAFYDSIDGVFILYPISWVVGAVLMAIYTKFGKWLPHQQLAKQNK